MLIFSYKMVGHLCFEEWFMLTFLMEIVESRCEGKVDRSTCELMEIDDLVEGIREVESGSPELREGF